MLKILLFYLIWLTLVVSKALIDTNGLPELKLPEVILVMIALSLRLMNKASKKQLTLFTAIEMIFYSVGLFYGFLIIIELVDYKFTPIWKISIELVIALFSMEIVNKGIKSGSLSVGKAIDNYFNKNTSPNDTNREV